MKKVFVSGCFDMLHSGHIRFFEQAAQLGELYVGLGSDHNIEKLKTKKTICTQDERLYQVKAVRFVTDAWINSGTGVVDFESELRKLHPDIFYVNQDGDNEAKELLCKSSGIQYIVGDRTTSDNLPKRSTSEFRKLSNIPYRIDLSGGWLDQPFVSSKCPGAVITVSIEPDYIFNERSGMASSTRKKAIELWQSALPQNTHKEQLAEILFCYDNPPGKKIISGSQDALGIVMPGLNKYYYNGDYWPSGITSTRNEKLLQWLQEHLFLLPLNPRTELYDPLENMDISIEKAQRLSEASENCWNSLMNQSLPDFARHLTCSFEVQSQMFPSMTNDEVKDAIAKYKSKTLGWKLTGAGGGGYLIFVAKEKPGPDFMQVRIVK